MFTDEELNRWLTAEELTRRVAEVPFSPPEEYRGLSDHKPFWVAYTLAEPWTKRKKEGEEKAAELTELTIGTCNALSGYFLFYLNGKPYSKRPCKFDSNPVDLASGAGLEGALLADLEKQELREQRVLELLREYTSDTTITCVQECWPELEAELRKDTSKFQVMRQNEFNAGSMGYNVLLIGNSLLEFVTLSGVTTRRSISMQLNNCLWISNVHLEFGARPGLATVHTLLPFGERQTHLFIGDFNVHTKTIGAKANPADPNAPIVLTQFVDRLPVETRFLMHPDGWTIHSRRGNSVNANTCDHLDHVMLVDQAPKPLFSAVRVLRDRPFDFPPDA
jgi:endonuclease/exonuclease/phosphatase family metal-dependent hydrolase